jgi:hypothetical protein
VDWPKVSSAAAGGSNLTATRAAGVFVRELTWRGGLSGPQREHVQVCATTALSARLQLDRVLGWLRAQWAVENRGFRR